MHRYTFSTLISLPLYFAVNRDQLLLSHPLLVYKFQSFPSIVWKIEIFSFQTY